MKIRINFYYIHIFWVEHDIKTAEYCTTNAQVFTAMNFALNARLWVCPFPCFRFLYRYGNVSSNAYLLE